jgi:outer membrane protein assembly factor BamE (lipoprotein component of BamABCDE complex)
MRNVSVFLVLLVACGCQSGGDHQEALHSDQDREMTLGIAQREIKVGMSQADVAAALGSPNIVSKDSEGDEAWIYDKIATEVTYSKDTGGASAGGATFVPGWILGLTGSADYRKSAGAKATTQKTLTVVIKFDKQGLVKNLSYHASKF